jgi:hypothetical protein
MPKKEMDYSNTVIYKIVCNDLNITECYVGHTTNFIQRKYKHKKNCTNNSNKHNTYNYKIYQTIRTNGGWNNWSMIEVEKYPCNDFNEATARERYWYEQLNAMLNTNYPARTKQEYYETNKEIILEYRKEYYETNKEQLLEKAKEYYESNKEQILEQCKEYYETNKEQIAEQRKEYYETNKEQIKIKKNQKFDCECGGKYTYCNKAEHLNSKKHKNYLTTKDSMKPKRESTLEHQPILHYEF